MLILRHDKKKKQVGNNCPKLSIKYRLSRHDYHHVVFITSLLRLWFLGKQTEEEMERDRRQMGRVFVARGEVL